MKLHRVYIGIDVHKKTHKVSFMPYQPFSESIPTWQGATFLDIENNINDFQKLHFTIKKYIQEPKEALIAIDHTGGHLSEPLIYYLQNMGYNIRHLETKGVKAARKNLLDSENKSDTIDARALSYLLYLRDVHKLSFRISSEKPELSSKAYLLRHLILQKQIYNKLLVQSTNRLHQFLLAIFPEGEYRYFKKLLRIIVLYPTPKDILSSHKLAGIKYVNRNDKEEIIRLAAKTVGINGELYRDAIISLSDQRIENKIKIEKITKSLEEEVTAHEYGPILLSFPYLGINSAATIISIIVNINRWPNKKTFKKTLGVYCTSIQSGSSVSKGRMGREGDKHSRRALFQVVFAGLSDNTIDNDFKDHYLRQVRRGKPKMKAIVATMGKLAEIIYHCLSKKELYEYRGTYRTK